MHTNTLQAKEAREFLKSLSYASGVKRLRGASFRENMDGTSDKFIGVLTIEARTADLKRVLIAIRVHGARQSVNTLAVRHTSGELLSSIASDAIPGIESPDLTPFRVGGLQVCYCAASDNFQIARETLAGYTIDYLQVKSTRGYKTPGWPGSPHGGPVSTFFKCMMNEFDLTGSAWSIGAQISTATMAWDRSLKRNPKAGRSRSSRLYRRSLTEAETGHGCRLHVFVPPP